MTQQEIDKYDRDHAPTMRRQQAVRLKRKRLRKEVENEFQTKASRE